MKRTLFLSTLLIMLAVQMAWAQVPQTISYQGVLTDTSGIVVPDGTFQLTFRIYDASTAGNLLLTEVHNSVPVNNGIFNVILGSITPLNIAFDGPRWLGVTIDSDPELTPRIELTSSPTSLNARTVADGAVTNSKLAANAATADKIAPNIVSSIAGVSNDGGDINLVAGSNITITADDVTDKITIAATVSGGDFSNGGEAAGADRTLGNTDNFDLGFLTNNTTRLHIQNDGNIGIGTTSPDEELHVVGNIKMVDGTQALGRVLTSDANGIGTWQTPTAAPDGDWTVSGSDMFSAVSGNVGIGTNTPNAILHTFKNVDSGEFNGLRVENPSAVGPTLTTIRIGESFGGFSADETGYLAYYGSGGASGEEQGTASTLGVLAAGGVSGGLFLATNHPSAPIRFFAGGGTASFQRMRIEANGNVGIGTLSPSQPLEMGSGAHVTSGGVWTNASSREHKENIRELTLNEALEALDRLEPVQFNYKIDEADNYLGFIAEDVPEVVASKDRKGLSSMDIVAVLTKVVQAQQRQIEALEARLNERK